MNKSTLLLTYKTFEHTRSLKSRVSLYNSLWRPP